MIRFIGICGCFSGITLAVLNSPTFWTVLGILCAIYMSYGFTISLYPPESSEGSNRE